jgi:hypothetical protein
VVLLVVSHWGLRILLAAIRNAWPALHLYLYVNDWTPSVTDTLDDYALATFPGFAPQALNRWTVPFQVFGATNSESDEQPHTFTQTEPADPIQTVYGYVVTTPYPHMVWAERFAVPQPLLTYNQQITVRPSLTLRNQT